MNNSIDQKLTQLENNLHDLLKSYQDKSQAVDQLLEKKIETSN